MRTTHDNILAGASTTVKCITGKILYNYTKCWWTTECSTHRKAYHKALNKYKNHRGIIQLWIDFNRAWALFRKTTYEARRLSWINFISKITASTCTTAEIWSKIRKICGSHIRRQIDLKLDDGELVTNTKDVTSTLVQRCALRSSIITSDPIFEMHKQNMEQNPIERAGNGGETYNLPFTLRELQVAIGSSKSRSPGPDTIPFGFIQNMSTEQHNKLIFFTMKFGIPTYQINGGKQLFALY